MDRQDRWALLGMFICYGVLDTGSTILFQLLGAANEGNEAARWFMGVFGTYPGLIINKALALALLTAIVVGHWHVLDHMRARHTAPASVWTVGRYTLPITIIAVGVSLAAWNALFIAGILP